MSPVFAPVDPTTMLFPKPTMDALAAALSVGAGAYVDPNDSGILRIGLAPVVVEPLPEGAAVFKSFSAVSWTGGKLTIAYEVTSPTSPEVYIETLPLNATTGDWTERAVDYLDSFTPKRLQWNLLAESPSIPSSPGDTIQVRGLVYNAAGTWRSNPITVTCV